MSSKRLILTVLALTFTLAACGGKDKVKNENEYKPGRDKELYETAEQKLKKSRYDEARLLYNVVITTYPDSEYLPLSKLSIADSFYLEGGSSNLEQAIGGYKDFAQYFPTHPLTCAVKLKIAHSHMRQMNAFNRDWTPAKKAELQLKATEISCQNSPLLGQIQQNLREVQQILGLHERDIANFYMANRQAYKAAEGRWRDIVANYPYFTYRDEALFKLGVALIEQEQPEEAAQFFTELLRNIPKSEFAEEAKKYLEKLGKPIPEPDPNAAAPERFGYFQRRRAGQQGR
jgi:outer membrane protein assembly factor BamD